MKRLKKILKWTGIVLVGLVAIGLVANAGFVWITDTRLERQLAAIRAAGDPISLADLARKPIPPEKNAATILSRAEAEVTATVNDVFYDDYFHFSDWCERWETGHPLPPEGLKSVRRALEAHPNVIPLLELAAACPDYVPQLDYRLPPEEFLNKLSYNAGVFRDVSRVLEFQAHLLVAEGKHDEAVRTGLLVFRLTDHFNRNPALTAYIVGITVRDIAIDTINLVLQSGLVSNKVRAALDTALAHQERTEGYAWAMKSEQAFLLDEFRTLPARNFWLLSREIWNHRESEYLDETQMFFTLTRSSTSYSRAEHMIRDMVREQTYALPLPRSYPSCWPYRNGICSRCGVLAALRW